MLYNGINIPCGLFILYLFIDLSLLTTFTSSTDNYPLNSNNTKPCARKKPTIDYVGAICVPDANDGWTPGSLENCRTRMKGECPEFNEASCEWYDYVPSDLAQKAKLGNTPLQLPCCRLKYFAAGGKSLTKYTWMEIFYTNQYGTSDTDKTVFDIVEIHRLIKNDEAFPNRAQGDWPESVQDGNGERGLPWKEVAGPLDIKTKLTEVCGKTGNTEAEDQIIKLLSSRYKEGFEPSKIPPNSDMETKHNAVITYEYKPSCSFAVIGGFKTPVWIFSYLRRSVYNHEWQSGKTRRDYVHNEATKFLEAQIYIERTKKVPRMRYAYYQYEVPEFFM